MDWLSLAANLAKFLVQLTNLINAHREYTSGWAGAVNAALLTQADQMAQVAEEVANADKNYSSDATDGAFDPEFKRSD
jgi:hypothetical protein